MKELEIPEARSRALLVTPIWPALSGNGLAMRAGLLLAALARDHQVDLWCVPVAGRGEGLDASIERSVVAPIEQDLGWTLARREGPEALRRLARPALCRFATRRAIADLHRDLGELDYRCTMVLRSYLLPFVIPLERAGGSLGARIVDLDDDEARTHGLLADLEADPQAAAGYRLEAELFESFEARHLPWAHRLLTAQEDHAQRLREQYPGVDTEWLPNAIETSSSPPRSSSSGSGEAVRILLVGNLSYLPNRAAAEELALEILPRLREGGLEVRLRLVGREPPESLRELAREPDVEVWADVPEVAPHYAWADQVVLPLRAGGGTRIKILEAFAHGVPVVSTPRGAEGLRVTSGTHLLLAESPRAIVEASCRLARSRELVDLLVREARAWVRLHHDRDQIVGRLGDQLQELPVTAG